MSEILEGDYQNNPMLIIRRDASDRFPFQFGLKKAQMILDHIQDIKAFVRKHDDRDGGPRDGK